MSVRHIGRSFPGGNWVEESCPCPQEPCGLIDQDKVDPRCTQHTWSAAKTIRQMHYLEDCPHFVPSNHLAGDSCMHCNHGWQHHSSEYGCIHGWAWTDGVATTEGCHCPLNNTEVPDANPV